jgi:AcrR family transcriptional regulator
MFKIIFSCVRKSPAEDFAVQSSGTRRWPVALLIVRKLKERIIDSARRLFNWHGFDNVSSNQVMAGAQLSGGRCYGHCASKSAL